MLDCTSGDSQHSAAAVTVGNRSLSSNARMMPLVLNLEKYRGKAITFEDI